MVIFLPLLFGLLALLSFPFDSGVHLFFQSVRTETGNAFMLWITNFTSVLIFFGVLAGAFLASSRTRHGFFPLAGSIVLALIAGSLLKMFLMVGRPEFGALTYEPTPSFPSLHTAVVFSVVPILWYRAKLLLPAWICYSVIIALSRMYVGVHFLSDIFGGVMIGLASGFVFVWLEQKHHLSERMLKIHFELRRQIAHLIIGGGIALLIYTGMIQTYDLFLILIAGGLLIIVYKKFPDRIPVITQVLSLFERKEDRKHFPGKGSFFLILGITLTMIVFPKDIAVPSIIILAVADSVNSITGRYFGSMQNPFNRLKSIEGSLIGCLAATSAASIFVGFWPAFFASLSASFVESLHVQIGKFHLNDNISIPLISGLVLSVWYG